MDEKPQRLEGRCLCGAVDFSVQPQSLKVDACHCGMCRRHTGGVAMALDCEPSSLTFTRDDGLALHASSDYGERAHCKVCGSSLVWRMRDGSFLSVAIGVFDRLPAAAEFTTEIYVDDKPPFYDFANDTKKLTGAQVQALFAAGGGQNE